MKALKIHFNGYQKLLDIGINKIKKTLLVLGKDAFLFILIFVLLEILFGEFLFYKYVFLLRIEEQKIVATPIKFKENVYQSVLQEWQVRENIFKNSLQENYQNPFE